MKYLITLMASLLFTGCASQPTQNVELEVISNVQLEKDTIRFHAQSSGCTKAEDFKVMVKDDEITVVRNKKDLCRASLHWLELSIKVDLSKGPYVIANPIATNTQSQAKRNSVLSDKMN